MRQIIAHSQTNQMPPHGVNTFTPLNFDGDTSEQAFETRGLNLAIGSAENIYLSSFPIPEDYFHYLSVVLGLTLPQIISVQPGSDNLSANIADDQTAKAQLADILNDEEGVLSVFTPTIAELELAEALSAEGMKIQTEFGKANLGVANKYGTEIILGSGIGPGGEIKLRHNTEALHLQKLESMGIHNFSDFSEYISAKYPGKVLFKHPFGTAGEGLWTKDQIEYVYDLIQNNNAIVVEAFFENATEHSLHLYVDPVTRKVSFVGVYDQKVKPTDNGGFAHDGCVYPSEHPEKSRILEAIATGNDSIGELLQILGVSGYICLDVLVNSDGQIHVMEINPRAGANLYALKLAMAVIQSKFGADYSPHFAFTAGVKIPANSITELVETYPQLLTYIESGQVVLSNYGRFAYNSWDLIFLSPESVTAALEIKEQIMQLLSLES